MSWYPWNSAAIFGVGEISENNINYIQEISTNNTSCHYMRIGV